MHRVTPILEDHANIDSVMEELDAVLRGLEGGTMHRLRKVVSTFAMLLEGHFAQEERSPMFEELPLEYPRFAKDIEALALEHIVMLTEVKTIRDSIDVMPRDEIAARLSALMKQLDAHEQFENALLQRAYTEDIGPSD